MIEIVERFKNDPESPPCAKLYFGHAETVVPLISLLGLFEGPPLTAEGFLLSKHRSFRSSAIVPYSSNIGFLIYRKLRSNVDGDMPEMLLQISVNEHLVNIPGQQHTVNIDIALNHFKSKIKEWNSDNCQTTQEYKRPIQDELWTCKIHFYCHLSKKHTHLLLSLQYSFFVLFFWKHTQVAIYLYYSTIFLPFLVFFWL